MAADPQSSREGLVSLKDYILGWLSVSWRLPSIFMTQRHLEKLTEENRESWGTLLEEAAQKYPENIAVKSAEATLTYKEYNEAVNRYANFFISQGLKKGDTAVVFLENRPELLAIYTAMGKIGVINSMINTNLRQEALTHCIGLNRGNVLIIGEEVVDAFEEVRPSLKLEKDQTVYFVRDGNEKSPPAGCIDVMEAAADAAVDNPPTTTAVTPPDILAYVFTSGTTGGMPKAAVVTHGRVVGSCYYTGKIVLNMKSTDTFYVPLPFFHTNALSLSWPCVFAGGAALAIRRKFSVSNFWDDVQKYHATVFCYIGELCRYLMNQPPTPGDKQNPLKKIVGNGLRPDIWKDFRKRFNICKVHEIYGAAESNLFFINFLNIDCTVGMCTRPYAIVAYDIEADAPIKDGKGFMKRIGKGETGLLLGEISETNPFRGYSNPAATEAKTLRNVFEEGDAWFNTGDLVRDIGYKQIQFVDRLGDTFRWKGENVSTTEVEKVANAFPQIAVSTVYGVAMPGSDGRAGMAAVMPEPDAADLDFQGLAEHFMEALPAYAVPKFIRLKTEFESTATYKIKKFEAKKEGFDPAVISDPLYVLLPDEKTYRPLTRELHAEILSGAYKF